MGKNFKKPNDNVDIYKLYLNEVGNHDILDQYEVVELIKQARNGDVEARNKIVEHNLKMVISIANKYCNNRSSILDLIQIGNEVIFSCIDNYNINSGIKFSYYLSKSIKYEIREQSLKMQYPVYLPSNVYEALLKIGLYCNNYLIINQREASNEEIINELKLNKKYVEIYNLIKDNNFSLSIDKIFLTDELDSENDFDSFMQYDYNLDNVLSKIDCERYISNSNLSDRDKEVLLYRYGFVDGNIYSLRKIAKKYNISAEGIRNIEGNSLRKIRKQIK